MEYSRYRRLRHGMPLVLAVVLWWAGSLPAQGQEARWTPENMIEVKRVGDARVSPDGQRIVYTVTEAVMTDDKSEYLTHLYLANTDGSDAYQFTYGDKSATNPQWSPDGQRIAYTSSRSGKSNVWVIRVLGGEGVALTDVETGVGAFQWSPDGTHIAFLMPDAPTEEEEAAKKGKDDAWVVDEVFKMNHLWVVAAALEGDKKPEPRRLTEGDFSLGSAFAGGFDWSPDGASIVFAHTPTPRVNDWPLADLSVVDVETATVTPLAETGASEASPFYAPDGRQIAYVASDDPPTWAFTSDVYVVSASGGTPRRLAMTYDRQPTLYGWSADGRSVYVSETQGTLTGVTALPVEGGSPQIVDLGDRVMGGININDTGTWIGFTGQSLMEPAEAFATALDAPRPVQVSQANAERPDLGFGRTEVIRWTSQDGEVVEGLLTYPVGYELHRRYPLLLMVHGGPTGVYTESFIGNPGAYPVAAFAAAGYAVLRGNIRGSSGYGRAFRYANYGDWGGMDYQDLMAGVDHVIQTGVADPERLGVMGWSYGGYMTSWIITQTDRFKSASIGAPVTNFMTFNATADVPGFIPDYFEGEHWERFDIYRARSPIFNIEGATTPTLIQHGERDDRVPISQGYELYHGLKQQGVDVQMVVYPRTPHGPREPKLLLDVMRRNMEWFKRHLMGDEDAGTN